MPSLKRQDKQGVRTPADVERKYNLGGANTAQYASEASRAASEAKQAAEEAKSLLADGIVSRAETLNGTLYGVNFTNNGSQTICKFETPAFIRGHTYLCFASIDGSNYTFVLSIQGDTGIQYSNSTMSGFYQLVVDYSDVQYVYLKKMGIVEDKVTEKVEWAPTDVSKDIRLYFTEIYNELD